eukprot:snap_masked-scaffold_44-processed-gene-1.82-mRNA-1 protein AED:0.32 eAED:0.32 QI:0/-1/0/1/-1/1/1/0/467
MSCSLCKQKNNKPTQKQSQKDIYFNCTTCKLSICSNCTNSTHKICPNCSSKLQNSPRRKKKTYHHQLNSSPKSTDSNINFHDLQNVRVVRNNLVYIIGLSCSISNEQLLKSNSYFGQYGKIIKLVISNNTKVSKTCSVYITYEKEEQAKSCITAVNGYIYDTYILRASNGTTKYCHAFLKGIPCTNNDCLFLHKLAEENLTFTKEEMQSSSKTYFPDIPKLNEKEEKESFDGVEICCLPPKGYDSSWRPGKEKKILERKDNINVWENKKEIKKILSKEEEEFDWDEMWKEVEGLKVENIEKKDKEHRKSLLSSLGGIEISELTGFDKEEEISVGAIGYENDNWEEIKTPKFYNYNTKPKKEYSYSYNKYNTLLKQPIKNPQKTYFTEYRNIEPRKKNNKNISEFNKYSPILERTNSMYEETNLFTRNNSELPRYQSIQNNVNELSSVNIYKQRSFRFEKEKKEFEFR